MMRIGNRMPVLIIGAITVALTVAVFFLTGIDMESALNTLGLAFLLLSELILFGGLYAVLGQEPSVLQRAGVISSLIIYFTATLISVLALCSIAVGRNTLIIVQLTIIAFFAIIIICVFTASRSIARREEIDMKKVGDNTPKRGGF